MTNNVFQCFKLNITSISHQQAVAEHWDLSNTEIFQFKDVSEVHLCDSQERLPALVSCTLPTVITTSMSQDLL
jgi:hypothetical protein